MDEEGRGAGRGECRGELARDVTRLADAGHDDAAAAIQDQRDRRDERVAEPRRECA